MYFFKKIIAEAFKIAAVDITGGARPKRVVIDREELERQRERRLLGLIHAGKIPEAKLLRAIYRGDRWQPGRWGVIQYHHVKEGYFQLPRTHNSDVWAFAKKSTPGYNAASNSLSRAVKRLQQRGLVRLSYREIAPTMEGYAIAARIEMQTPGAFGFTPIPQDRLKNMLEEARRMPTNFGKR